MKRWFPLCVFAFVFIFYSRTIGFEFLNWDDPLYVTDHLWYRPFRWPHLVHMWNPLSLWRDLAVDFAPIRDMTYVIDHLVWNGQAFGFHFTNVALHALNAALVFIILSHCTLEKTAFLLTCLWALHPLCVEPVAWISSRKDLLLGTFTFSSILFTLRWRAFAYTASLIGALLSKYTAAAVFAFHFVSSFFDPKGRKMKHRTWIAALFCVLGSTLIVYAVLANRHIGRVVRLDDHTSLLSSWPAGFQAFTHAVSKILVPIHLSARYVQEPLLTWSSWKVIGGLFVFALLMIGLFTSIKRRKAWAPGLILCVFTLCIHLPIVPTNLWLADRYLYLPLFGVIWITSSALGFIRSKFVAPVLLALMVVFGTLSQVRLPVWKDSQSLWKATSVESPSLYYVWGNLARAQFENSETHSAIASMKHALSLFPSWHVGHVQMAKYYQATGRQKDAIQFLEAAEKDPPNELQDTARERAILWAKLGFLARGREVLKRYLEKRPTDAAAWANLGVMWIEEDHSEQALIAWNRALELDSREHGARLNRARFYYSKGACKQMNEDLSKVRSLTDAESRQVQAMLHTCKAH